MRASVLCPLLGVYGESGGKEKFVSTPKIATMTAANSFLCNARIYCIVLIVELLAHKIKTS